MIEHATAALDGGSILLQLRDQDGQTHELELVQHMFPMSSDPRRVPGRLYFDGALVPVRSPLEKSLLAGVREASIAFVEGSAGDSSAFVRELSTFVESDRYA